MECYPVHRAESRGGVEDDFVHVMICSFDASNGLSDGWRLKLTEIN